MHDTTRPSNSIKFTPQVYQGGEKIFLKNGQNLFNFWNFPNYVQFFGSHLCNSLKLRLLQSKACLLTGQHQTFKVRLRSYSSRREVRSLKATKLTTPNLCYTLIKKNLFWLFSGTVRDCATLLHSERRSWDSNTRPLVQRSNFEPLHYRPLPFCPPR